MSNKKDKTDMIDLHFSKNRYGEDSNPVITGGDRRVFTLEAKIAVNLVEKWGLAAAENNGEDSSGRGTLRILSAAEMVAKACNVAELLSEEIEKRGWMVVAPTIDSVKKTFLSDDT